MRLLAIDFGNKYIGLAVTDPLKITARPFKTLKNNPEVTKEIAQICTEEEVEKIILGLPRSLDGTINQQAEKTLAFQKSLAKEVENIPIELEEEQFTTKMAHENLRDQKKSVRESREIVNQEAAYLILQSYLENHQ